MIKLDEERRCVCIDYKYKRCSESPVSLVIHFSGDNYWFPFIYQCLYLSALNIYNLPINIPSRIDHFYGIIKRKNLLSDDAYFPDELEDWRPDGSASQKESRNEMAERLEEGRLGVVKDFHLRVDGLSSE